MSLFTWAEEKFKNFTFWDIGVFKLALIAFGMILGAYFAMFVMEYMLYFWIVFIAAYIYLVFKMFQKK